MMLRSVHLPLGFVVSPLFRCGHRLCSPSSLPSTASLKFEIAASLQRSFVLPPCPRSPSVFGAFRMSSGGPNTNSDVDAASVAAAAPPVLQTPKIRFCHSCGNPTKQVIPDGEEKIRAVCTVCSKIHYENPKMDFGRVDLELGLYSWLDQCLCLLLFSGIESNPKPFSSSSLRLEALETRSHSVRTLHYQIFLKKVVGCLVEHNDKVLLCRRKIEPSYGL
ncbi:hypothetical protein ZIOFF_030103 [Zingiber officinale]|uniref:Nudix hydrolase N-terminal domain-containing protein n=1 Tax=Zingiber officinale TaxID=94328 RepID=A0A8J5GNU6_ZINOF|nr:hypothetical protein ZIOFF_030103 [Zingiber officinale]